MATPPRVTQVELSRTLWRIYNRRVKHDDPALDVMPNPDECHPQDMLDYLRKHPTGVPRTVVDADVSDALVLCAWLWWQQRREELSWLTAGRKRRLFLSVLGGPLGVGKRGVLDRIDRHEALLGDTGTDRPDEKVTREQRRAQRQRRERNEAQQAWLDEHTDELSELVSTLVEQADRFELDEDEREWLDEAARDAADREFTPGSMTAVALAVGEVQTAPAVVALDSSRPYTVHEVLARLERLRSEFAAVDQR